MKVAKLGAVLPCAIADVTITQDITSGFLCSDKAVGLTRVNRIVNITYPYALQNIGQFPDMNLGSI